VKIIFKFHKMYVYLWRLSTKCVRNLNICWSSSLTYAVIQTPMGQIWFVVFMSELCCPYYYEVLCNDGICVENEKSKQDGWISLLLSGVFLRLLTPDRHHNVFAKGNRVMLTSNWPTKIEVNPAALYWSQRFIIDSNGFANLVCSTCGSIGHLGCKIKCKVFQQ